MLKYLPLARNYPSHPISNQPYGEGAFVLYFVRSHATAGTGVRTTNPWIQSITLVHFSGDNLNSGLPGLRCLEAKSSMEKKEMSQSEFFSDQRIDHLLKAQLVFPRRWWASVGPKRAGPW